MPEGEDVLRASRPGPALAARLTRMAGADNRYASCDDGTVMVAAGRWAAVVAHASAMRHAAVAEAIRRSPDPSIVGRMASAGDMPVRWEFGMEEQIGLELSCSPGSAGRLLEDSWQLAVRLPLTWAALHSGVLDLGKARLIVAETAILSDADAGEAERQLAESWAGKTWAQLHARITKIVVNIDPDAVEKKRERAQRDEARVRFWRETTGAAALAGYGLPPDEALQADARIQSRARAYRKAGVAGNMDQLRAAAYLDLINGSDARDRLGLRDDTDESGEGFAGSMPDAADDGREGESDRWPDNESGRDGDDWDEAGWDGPDEHHRPSDVDAPDDSRTGAGDRDDDGWPDDDDFDDDWPDGNGGARPSGGGPRGNGPGGQDGAGRASSRDEYGDGIAANLDLTLPLATLANLAERAGEAARMGAIDPTLVRRLAHAAIRNRASRIRVIITGQDGRAVGFGIAKERRKRDTRRGNPPPAVTSRPSGSTGQATAPESRPSDGRADRERASQKQASADAGSDREKGAAMSQGTGFTFRPAPGPDMLPLDGPDGAPGPWGRWRLAAAGREWDVELIPLPMPRPCTHEYATASYQPGRILRHLVQIRDGQCAMPNCGHLAVGTQWEHAIPWPTGQTCSCNGGLHCVRHHRVKDQAKGWTIVQLADGRRRWTTPKGLTYTSEHRSYPD